MIVRPFVYRASRTNGKAEVFANDTPLNPRFDIASYYPNHQIEQPFAWGNGSPRASQLALAMVAFHSGDRIACRYAMNFKWLYVYKMPPGEWEMTEKEMIAAMRVVMGKEPRGLELPRPEQPRTLMSLGRPVIEAVPPKDVSPVRMMQSPYSNKTQARLSR